MKRKYRQTQKRVDEAILASIKVGKTTKSALKQVLVDGWQDYSIGELVDAFARTELSAAKQRLRSRGEIEITKGNEPKLAGELSIDDAAFIDERRASHIAGELKTRIEFNRRYGRIEQAKEAERQLRLFGFEVEAVEPDLAYAVVD